MEAKTPTPTVQESTIVERVARSISSVRGSKPDYTLMAAELEPAIPFDIFGVVLLRHDRLAVRVTVCQREGGFWRATYHQHPIEGSKVAQLLHDPVMIVTDYPNGLDGSPAQCGDALSGCHQIRSTVIAPLIVGEHVLGSLELGSVILNAYADSTLQRLIGAVVRVLAAAIESAQMGGSAEIQNRQRQALKAVTSALTSKMDLPSIFTQIVEGVAKALHVASAIVTIDQGGERLRLEAQSGLEPSKLHRIIGRKENLGDQSIIGYTLRRRQPCVSNDIFADERFPRSYLFTTELGMRSVVSHPLVTGTTVCGALLLCSSEPGGFTPLKADILSLFASQATIAIHNGMLIEAAQQRSRFQKAIEQLECAYAHNGDDAAMLAQVRHEVEHTFGVSFGSLLHFISDHLLTRSERELQAMLQTTQASVTAADTASPHIVLPPSISSSYPFAEHMAGIAWEALSPSPWQDASVMLLTQTAEAALVRAEMLSELGRLLTQFNHTEQDSLKDSWFVVDLNGLCIYMNPTAEIFSGRHMGTTTENRLEDVFADVLPRIRNAAEVRVYLHDFSQGIVNRKDVRCILAIEPITLPVNTAGTFTLYQNTSASASADHHYQLSRYPLYNQQNTHIANVLQVHDVTEQVHEERNKSALLSSVSHDLRTPLTTIKVAVTGLLQEGVEWDEQTRREILEDIDAEADHLGILVHALVELSRIEMGALVLEKEWCDIVEIGHGAIGQLERVLVGRTVRLHIQPGLPLIYADHVQLERVFYNLLENATRHSPDEQEILLSFTTVMEAVADSPQQYVCVKVIDHGEEVPVGEREGIFKTFYGVKMRRSGLGLAICRGIVEAHQGRISVETPPDGNGSCFVFTLPVHTYTHTRVPTSSGNSHAVLGSEQVADTFLPTTLPSLHTFAQTFSNEPSTVAPTMEVSDER